jgi:SAM-dependent methyltransferase
MRFVRIISTSFSCMILSAATAVNSLPQTPGPERQAESGSPAQGNAQRATPPQALVHFEAVNSGETWGGGDKLAVPRLIAAAVVGQDNPAPRMVVDVGSYTGEFLEAFLEKFPAARGQWTEPVDMNLNNAKRRFARFGDRVDYRIGCPGRDISDGCVPKAADVIITSWVSVHQPKEGIAKFYRNAAAQLPSGGWLVNLDHIGFGGNAWERRFQAARQEFHAVVEGPPQHLKTPVPTLDDQLAAFKAAGFDDVEVVWRSFTTCLFMARKK